MHAYVNDMMQVLQPLAIGFAVFMVHLATIRITGTGINPARSFAPAVMYNKQKAWNDHVCILKPHPLLKYCFLFHFFFLLLEIDQF